MKAKLTASFAMYAKSIEPSLTMKFVHTSIAMLAHLPKRRLLYRVFKATV